MHQTQKCSFELMQKIWIRLLRPFGIFKEFIFPSRVQTGHHFPLAEMLSPSPSLLSPTSALAFKTLKPASLYYPSLHFSFPFPVRLHHRRFLCLASSDNNPIQSVLFPSIIDPASTHLPAVRTYESNLAILSITGSASSNQAVAAAAADGGAAAEEHLSSGAEAMVIETVFPGGITDGNSTVSTKLVSPSNFFLFFFGKK